MAAGQGERAAVLAGDLGGTHCRAALIDDAGTILKSAVRPSPVERDGEIDPADWWAVFGDLCTELLAGAAPRPRAIAVCGVTRSQVLLDAAGQVVRPAPTWNDVRSAATIEALRAALPADHPETAQVNPFHPLARLHWLRTIDPASAARVATVLDPKDYLNFRLTGRRASDPVSLARLAGGRDLLAAIGLSPAVLPDLVEPWATLGPVRTGLAAPFDRLAGLPVMAASNDTWAAVAGLGAMRPGMAYNISGTTEVFGVVSAEAGCADGLLSVNWRGVHQLGGPGQNGADTARWLGTLLGQDGPAALDDLLRQPRHPDPVLFLPYLRGERVPYWDARLRGAFVGLNRDHRGVDLAFAVLEGVAFLNRVVLDRAEAALGAPVAEIRFGGGAAASPLWRQIKADVCDRDVVVGASPEAGLLGAAVVGWTAAGRYPTLDAAQEAMVRLSARVHPDPARVAVYRRLFALYRAADAALAPLSHGLTEPGLRAPDFAGVAF